MATTGWTVRAHWKRHFGTAATAGLRGRLFPRVGGPRFWMLAMGGALAGVLALVELETSRLQSQLLGAAASRIGFTLEPGPSPAIHFPETGPYDQRLGYSRLETFTARLAGAFDIEAQARSSDLLLRLMARGLPAIYHGKPQAGLAILDRAEEELYRARFPDRVYRSYDEIPPLVVRSLLFVENRRLLDADRPYANPTIEWVRLGRAFVDLGLHAVDRSRPVSGGSTLATQLEKVRHSPEGRTDSLDEKARQVVAASLRAYLDGDRTLEARRRIVLDYVNSLPLGAIAGHGEIVGLGDGLWAWFDADFDETNRLVRAAEHAGAGDPGLAVQAAAYRRVLSLLLAIKRPSIYLPDGQERLEARVDGFLRALSSAGIVPEALARAALEVRVQPRTRISAQGAVSFLDRKSANAVRFSLLQTLGVRDLYDLDRLDLSVWTTLDAAAGEQTRLKLRELAGREGAAAAGLLGPRLLSRGDPAAVVYSLTLYERGEGANLLRVQIDTFDGPLDINDGTRMELGSTAKLRTLVTYLEIVAQLHARHAEAPRDVLELARAQAPDRLSRWAVDHLLDARDRSLPAMLEAAMTRRYSASPAETFFTGGGVHRFSNFDGSDNHRIMTVRQAMQHSVNLVFIRLMRDIVEHYTALVAGDTRRLFEDRHDPRRQVYLERFADQEGRLFLRRFYAAYGGLPPDEALVRLAESRRPSPRRAAAVFRSVRPEAGVDELEAFFRLLGLADSRRSIEDLHRRLDPSDFSLNDRAYLAGVHPLALWLVTHLQSAPDAMLGDVVEASAAERREAYDWLFRTRNLQGQNRRIRTLLEEDAFRDLHLAWQRQGYRFGALVPSYATALGSSGDSPAALAELAGIIVNDGVRYPAARIERLRFAAGTPFETRLTRRPAEGERVLPVEVAVLLRQELTGIVQHGTGRRLAGLRIEADGERLALGGKTGTGDNRFENTGVLNRTAAFVFTIGDRYFGTILAYVPGPDAAHYRFTSSLPVQVLRELLPGLIPRLERADDAGDPGPPPYRPAD